MPPKVIYIKVECDKKDIPLLQELCRDLNTVLPAETRVHVDEVYDPNRVELALEERIRREQEQRVHSWEKKLKEKEAALREHEKLMRAEIEQMRKTMLDAIGNSLHTAPAAKKMEISLKEAVQNAIFGNPTSGTQTGRAAANEINFKNIPKEPELRGTDITYVEVDSYDAIEELFLNPNHRAANKEFMRRLKQNIVNNSKTKTKKP